MTMYSTSLSVLMEMHEGTVLRTCVKTGRMRFLCATRTFKRRFGLHDLSYYKTVVEELLLCQCDTKSQLKSCLTSKDV